jgi:hypothetical protein
MIPKLLLKFLPASVMLLLLAVSACQIEEIVYDENPFVEQKNLLSFKKLQQSNPSINLTDSLIVQAIASGDSLSFSWSVSDGTLAGNDSIAIFRADTTGVYTISCTATDKYNNSETREVEVMVVMELVMNGITASDLLLPPGVSANLTALASGEELSFTWTASGGEITGEGSQVEFKSANTGIFRVNCQVQDKYNAILTQELDIEVTNQLIYKNLEAAKTTIQAYEATLITAQAYGEGLMYEWNAEPMGVLLGYNETVQFSNCCANTHVISCRIRDNKGNSEIKYITITIIE